VPEAKDTLPVDTYTPSAGRMIFQGDAFTPSLLKDSLPVETINQSVGNEMVYLEDCKAPESGRRAGHYYSPIFVRTKFKQKRQ